MVVSGELKGQGEERTVAGEGLVNSTLDTHTLSVLAEDRGAPLLCPVTQDTNESPESQGTETDPRPGQEEAMCSE